jgi:hypothetical protein
MLDLKSDRPKAAGAAIAGAAIAGAAMAVGRAHSYSLIRKSVGGSRMQTFVPKYASSVHV